jgi:tetratricopeptide (TPR) repeat protein
VDLPDYIATGDLQALEQRLTALTTAGQPAACPVHVSLGAPTEYTNNFGHLTHAIASHLVDGRTDLLPPINTAPKLAQRLHDAASWGRVDAMTSEFTDMPTDLTNELWKRVVRISSSPESLTGVERSVAAEVLMRLGYPLTATEILGLSETEPSQVTFHPESVRAELTALRWRWAYDRLEQRVLEGAADLALSPASRIRLANFVVVINGKRGADTPAFHRAADLGRAALAELTDEADLARCLAEHTHYRAVAYEPFMRKDLESTLICMDRAEHALLRCRPESPGVELLAWLDHAFPMYETLSKIFLADGDIPRALESTARLVEVDPRDSRAWHVRARTLATAGDLEQAVDAWERILPMGGLPVASASFYLGWASEQLGHTAEAREFYALSASIDPTPIAIAEWATP